jgi:hypothetical protein
LFFAAKGRSTAPRTPSELPRTISAGRILRVTRRAARQAEDDQVASSACARFDEPTKLKSQRRTYRSLSRRAFLCSLLSVPIAPAFAREVGSVKLPDQVRLTADGPILNLTGAGHFRFLFVRHYVCGLYTLPHLKRAEAILTADAPRRVIMVAIRRLSAFEFLFGLDQGISDNLTLAEQKALAADFDRVRATIRTVEGLREGQRVALDYLPSSGVRIVIDDIERASFATGKPLADALLKVWIGERPLDEALKEALLAG